MVKRNYSRFNQAKRILSKQEYAEYKKQIVEVKRAELQKQLERGRENLKNFQSQQKYAKSRSGKLGQAISRTFETARRGGITRKLYSRSMPVNSSNVQRVTPPMQRQNLIQARAVRQQRQAIAQRQQANQNYYDWAVINMANPRHNTAQIVENEINRIGGHSSVGDSEAFRMSNLANLSNPIVSVELEANRHSNIQHLNPISRMNQEVNFFSNMVF